MATDFGKAWPRLRPHLWWRYDITTGLAYTWNHLGRRGRFYGITIGRWAIGIVTTPKERSNGS